MDGKVLQGLVVAGDYAQIRGIHYTSWENATQIRSTGRIEPSLTDPFVYISEPGKMEGGLFARRARELGIHVPLVSQRPIQSPELLDQAAAVEGMVYSYPAYDVEYPFIQKFIDKYGKQPTIFAVEAYDAVITLAKATESCRSDSKCIHEWYLDREYAGALGQVKFDGEGDAHYPFVLKQVKNGEFVFYNE